MKLSYTLIVSAVAIMCPRAAVADLSQDELAAHIEQVETATRGLDTMFRISMIGSLDNVDAIVLTERPGHGVEEVIWTHFRWRDRNGRVRADRLDEGAVDKTYVWTGQSWYEWTMDRAMARVYPIPRHDMTTDCWAWFNINDWRGLGAIGPLSEMIRATNDFSCISEAGVHTATFTFPGNPENRTEIIVESIDPLRIRSIRQTIMREGPGAMTDNGDSISGRVLE
ncbi:MAG: hypothetical protein ACR2GY_11065 [Phycisphaerales bacterium]